ncbi:unnamed protein product [Onchocerca ochengi]|uniref:Dynein light chain n=1 Tax=Onchocerca ochengi TaxID=42157 RepID=A0A182E8M3_ONCOC|nr:unnamed protein product [Onchocerca ochengi]
MFNRQPFSQLRRQSRRWHNSSKKSRPPEITIRSTDFNEQLQEVVKENVKQAMNRCSTENEIASFLKRKFDELEGPCWNCIVGRNFGSHVECTSYIHLIYCKISVILYKID